ncbi:MAG TPA: hypothetical protein VFV50_04770 [Bdellovibrionales bacterium]|nr:hypothetical protein [Bdellovibrionales bacterium]
MSETPGRQPNQALTQPPPAGAPPGEAQGAPLPGVPQAPPKPQVNMNLPAWGCDLSTGAETGRAINNQLTVGQVLTMKCAGPEIGFDPLKIKLVVPGDPKGYALKILRVKALQPSGGEFDVTTYAVGEHRDAQFVLTDGAKEARVEPLSYNVRSVIPQGQPPEPFGPFGPWQMSWPLWWWLVLIGAIILLGLFIWRRGRKIAKQRKLRLEVEEYCKRHFPFDEFQRELRQMDRKLERGQGNPREMVQAMSQSFRLFLMRTLVIPAPELGDRALRREVWKRYKTKLKKETHQDLTKFITELRRADRPDIQAADVAQLVDWAQKLSESIDESVGKGAA